MITNHSGFPNPPAHDVEVCRRRLAAMTHKCSVWERVRILKFLYTITHNKAMLTILKSKKLWITVGVAALTSLLSGLGFAPETVGQIINLAMTYLIGQSVVDSALVIKGEKKS